MTLADPDAKLKLIFRRRQDGLSCRGQSACHHNRRPCH